MKASNTLTLVKALEGLAGRTGLGVRREHTRRRLVAAAAHLFIESGYRRTSMEDIASAGGVARPTVYTYAKTKEQMLLMTVAEEALGATRNAGRRLRPEAARRTTSSHPGE